MLNTLELKLLSSKIVLSQCKSEQSWDSANFAEDTKTQLMQLQAIVEETYAVHERRSLLGFKIRSEGIGAGRRVASITLENGTPLERD